MAEPANDLTDDLAGDVRLLEAIVQTSFNVFSYLSMGREGLTDDDLRWIFQRAMSVCHEAAAQPGAVQADAQHVAFLDYDLQAITTVEDLMGTVFWLCSKGPDNLRQANQRLPASQWMQIGGFFRQGLRLLSAPETVTAERSSRPVVALTPLLEALIERHDPDVLLRRLTDPTDPDELGP